MTKKDYELIAHHYYLEIGVWKEICGPVWGQEAIKALTDSAKHLAGKLERENPKFQKDKFLAACGIED